MTYEIYSGPLTPPDTLSYTQNPSTCGYIETMTVKYYKDSVELSSTPSCITFPVGFPYGLTVLSSDPNDAGIYIVKVTNEIPYNSMKVIRYI